MARVLATIRPYSAWDKRLLLGSALSFAASVALFVAVYMTAAKIAFGVFILAFCAFVARRIRMQLKGVEITLLEVSAGEIRMAKLKTLPFFETEVAGQVRMDSADVAKISANMTAAGSVADPSCTIGFHMQDGRYIYNELPFNLIGHAGEIIQRLKSRLPSVEFEIDDGSLVLLKSASTPKSANPLR